MTDVLESAYLGIVADLCAILLDFWMEGLNTREYTGRWLGYIVLLDRQGD